MYHAVVDLLQGSRRCMPKERASKAVSQNENILVERVQTGVRFEKRLLKVLKSLAEYHDLTLGDLLEGIVLHAFEGKAPFGSESIRRIAEFKKIYGLDLSSAHAHKLIEASPTKRAARRRK